jgi:hypothetical protein
MNAPPICTRCKLSMERVPQTPDLYRCPLCSAVKREAEAPKVPSIPKCPICNRRCVPQADWFVCPSCKHIVDDQQDGITDASYDKHTRRLQRQEDRTRLSRASHRGGTYRRYGGRPAGLR